MIKRIYLTLDDFSPSFQSNYLLFVKH